MPHNFYLYDVIAVVFQTWPELLPYGTFGTFQKFQWTAPCL